MSGPNTNYDPVEVTPLGAEAVQAMVDEALAAFAAATTMSELKAARLAHAGDRSPLALANREIGALPPASLRAAGGRAPISRLASARGDRSPACASRAALSSDIVVAAANAASASSTMAWTASAPSGVTSTGS